MLNFAVPALFVCLAAGGPGDFEAVKADAKEIKAPHKAIEALIGHCASDDAIANLECKQTMQKKAQRIRGQEVYLFLGPVERGLMADRKRGEKMRMVWTPIVDLGNNTALTLQVPNRVDKNGSAKVKKKVMDGYLGKGVLPSEMNRLARTGSITVELVGKFGRTWAKGAGGEIYRGVVFQMTGLRLAHARSGKTLFTYVE